MLALHDLHEGIWVLKAFKPQWQHPCSDWYLSLFVCQTGLKEPFQKSVPLIKQAKHATCFSSLQQPENIGRQTSILLSHRICAGQISSRSLAPGLCTGYNASSNEDKWGSCVFSPVFDALAFAATKWLTSMRIRKASCVSHLLLSHFCMHQWVSGLQHFCHINMHYTWLTWLTCCRQQAPGTHSYLKL